MRGYKAFGADMTCRGKQYAVGAEYFEIGDIEVCGHGMHFCETCDAVFDYYGFDRENVRVCEVEAIGDIKTSGNKSCTNHLRILRELTWDEVLLKANSGCDNTGHGNSGDRNSGDRNSGYRNSGYRNSGDWNSTNFSSGVLCTEEPECLIFDKPSGMTLREWRDSDAAVLMSRIEADVDTWVDESRMTDDEKEHHPEYEILGGYLRRGTYRNDFAGWWEKLTDKEKAIIMSIPNFDAGKWKMITGIDVTGGQA